MVETQLCKLRGTSDTFVGRAYYKKKKKIPSVSPRETRASYLVYIGTHFFSKFRDFGIRLVSGFQKKKIILIKGNSYTINSTVYVRTQWTHIRT